MLARSLPRHFLLSVAGLQPRSLLLRMLQNAIPHNRQGDRGPQNPLLLLNTKLSMQKHFTL